MKYILLIILLITSWYTHAQNVVVAHTRFNVLYIGENNRIKVAASNTPCSDIKLVIDNSKVEPTGNPCEYNVTVYKPGSAVIKVYNKRTDKLLAAEYDRVKYYSEKFKLTIGKAKSGGTLNKRILPLLKSIGLSTGADHHHGYVVHSYTVSILRSGQQVYYRENNGVYFDDEIKAVFKTLQSGDKLFVYDVIIDKNGDKQPYILPSIFTVK